METTFGTHIYIDVDFVFINLLDKIHLNDPLADCH